MNIDYIKSWIAPVFSKDDKQAAVELVLLGPFEQMNNKNQHYPPEMR